MEPSRCSKESVLLLQVAKRKCSRRMQSDQWGSIHIENPILLKIKWNNVGGF